MNPQIPPPNLPPTTSGTHAPQESLTSRSCVTCRRRKVRCNKRSPCSNCIKAGIECVFPAPGRARRKTKRPQDVELLSRLRRLEGVIEQISTNGNNNTADPAAPQVPPNPPTTTQAAQATPSPVTSRSEDVCGNNEQPQNDGDEVCPFLLENDPRNVRPKNLEHEFGRLVIDEGRSRYVSNRFWASLGDEIEELQDILDPTSSEDEDYPSPESASTQSGNHDAFLFGFQSMSLSLRQFHPPADKVPVLCHFYFENVAPLISILHKPSAKTFFQETAPQPESLDKNSEALVFALYLVTVVSMSPEECLAQLDEDRGVLVNRYRFAVEQALAKANLLNTQSLMLLQAASLFLIGVRREDDTKFVWSMTAVVLRLAQGIGLHRDGTNFGLKPFETEMRRRLWWHICLLDLRSSEDHGTDAQIHERSYDTRLPLNVNDDDISPGMETVPTEQVGCTDMTFTLIRCEITTIIRRVSYVCPSGLFRFGPGQPSMGDGAKMIQAINRRIEERYIRHCDTSIPIYWVCATVARLILAKLWLVVHHPMTRQDRGANLSYASRESLFLTSIEVLEFGRLLESNEKTAKWGWQFRINMQWHAVAFVLAELCVRPLCPVTDRAWMAMTLVYDEWEHHVRQKKGMLWRPLARLMKRASAFRTQQLAEAQAQYGPIPAQTQLSSFEANVPNPLPRIHIPSDFPTTTTAAQPGQTFNPQPHPTPFDEIDLNKGQLDIFRDLFPDTDWLSDQNGPVPSTTTTSATAATSGPTPSSMSTSDEMMDTAMVPVDNQRAMSTAQLNWDDWDQVMRDFQMDVQRTQATRPMGNVSDWFV